MTIDLYEAKLKRMSNTDLLRECIVFLSAMEQGGLSKDNKIRATKVFKEGAGRQDLEISRDDLLVALKVLKFF